MNQVSDCGVQLSIGCAAGALRQRQLALPAAALLLLSSASEAFMKVRVVYMSTGMHMGNAAILGECGVVAKRVGHWAFSFPVLARASVKRLRFLDSWALVTLRECLAWSNPAFKAGGTFPMHTVK